MAHKILNRMSTSVFLEISKYEFALSDSNCIYMIISFQLLVY
jgi:hypothetical protein